MKPKNRSFSQEWLGLAKAMYLPMSERDQQRYSAMIEDRVAFYQPKIEERTGVQLGKVYVLPNMFWLYLSLWDVYQKGVNPDINPQAKDMPPFQKNYVKAVAPFIAGPLTVLAGIPMAIIVGARNEVIDMGAYGEENIIRVPTGFESRLNLWREDCGRSSNLDEKVVHELGHLLWSKIEKKEPKNSEFMQAHTWEEGFATYGMYNFFGDLYPLEYQTNPKMVGKGGVYARGLEKVIEAVKKHGEDIFLQIPNKWRELENGKQ